MDRSPRGRLDVPVPLRFDGCQRADGPFKRLESSVNSIRIAAGAFNFEPLRFASTTHEFSRTAFSLEQSAGGFHRAFDVRVSPSLLTQRQALPSLWRRLWWLVLIPPVHDVECAACSTWGILTGTSRQCQ
jgi:hypothetical protein